MSHTKRNKGSDVLDSSSHAKEQKIHILSYNKWKKKTKKKLGYTHNLCYIHEYHTQ